MVFRCEAVERRAVLLRAVSSTDETHPNRAIWPGLQAGELGIAELPAELVAETFAVGREFTLELRAITDDETTAPGVPPP
jgi:hypothetical protein